MKGWIGWWGMLGGINEEERLGHGEFEKEEEYQHRGRFGA